MGPIERMNNIRDTFTKKETDIYNLFINKPDEILRGEISSWSHKYSISQSTLTRFCQKLGYKGFNEFKYDYFRYEKMKENDELENFGKDKLDYYVELIHAIRDYASKDDLISYAKMIKDSDTIYIMGSHKSSLPAQMFSTNLKKLSKKSFYINDNAIQDFLNYATEDDLLIIITDNGGILKSYMTDIYKEINAKMKVMILSLNSKLEKQYKSNAFVLLPASSNLNLPVYLENQIMFFIVVDLITSHYANISRT